MTRLRPIDENLVNLAKAVLETKGRPAENGAALVSFLQGQGVRTYLQRNTSLWREVAGDQSAEASDADRRYTLQTAGFAFSSATLLSDISESLRQQGIRVLTLKGLAWSQLFYGDIITRAFGDIDLLVHPKDRPRVEAHLIERGLTRGYPSGFSQGQEHAFHRFGKAQNYSDRANHRSVDLHWRLFSQWVALEIPFDDLWRRRQQIQVHNFPAWSTLSAEDALIFTALHIAQDGWANLKGLLDLAMLLAKADYDWSRVVRIAGSRLPLVAKSATFAVD